MNLVSDCCGAELLGSEVDYICFACREHCNAVPCEEETLPVYCEIEDNRPCDTGI